jgi:tRNA threonylcarbamoyladenosine biosynthesis protein TsaB
MTKSTYILNLETTTHNCSVSLSRNGKQIALKEVNEGSYSHAELLHPFIKKVMVQTGVTFEQLNAVAVSSGPGSYTGLRIGVSAAKGISFAQEIPLISVNTMEVLARQVAIEKGVIIPILDARRMEVYHAIFDQAWKLKQATDSHIVEGNSYQELLDSQKVYFVGNAVEKMQEKIQHSNAVFLPQSYPSAKEMNEISYQKFLVNDFENLAYFEPFYLKEFIAVKKR